MQLLFEDLTTNLYISELGPIKRAYERNDAKVQTWLKEEYPAIKTKSKKENTEKFMQMLEKNPQRVSNYFEHEKIAYFATS